MQISDMTNGPGVNGHDATKGAIHTTGVRRDPIIITLTSCLLMASCLHERSVDGRPPAPDPLLRMALAEHMAERTDSNTPLDNRAIWSSVADGARVSPDSIRLFYTRREIHPDHRASGKHQNETNFWNREHVWPRSYGLKKSPADKDLHNLVPTDRTVNSSRGNKAFGRAEQPHHECHACRVAADVFEPPDVIKGDVARMLFYMDVRYTGADGTPDLVLGDVPDMQAAVFGPLSTLMAWHCDDPVSDEERRRHEAAAGAQGNRNVFIDKPDLALRVFGFACH